MKLVLAVVGDRRYSDWAFFQKILKDQLEKYPAAEIVTGDATGVDTMALRYARDRGIPVTVYCASKRTWYALVLEGVNAQLVANWDTDGRAAGHIRNRCLLRHPPDRVLLLDGGGLGSWNIQTQAQQIGIEVERWEIVWHAGTVSASVAEDLSKNP